MFRLNYMDNQSNPNATFQQHSESSSIDSSLLAPKNVSATDDMEQNRTKTKKQVRKAIILLTLKLLLPWSFSIIPLMQSFSIKQAAGYFAISLLTSVITLAVTTLIMTAVPLLCRLFNRKNFFTKAETGCVQETALRCFFFQSFWELAILRWSASMLLSIFLLTSGFLLKSILSAISKQEKRLFCCLCCGWAIMAKAQKLCWKSHLTQDLKHNLRYMMPFQLRLKLRSFLPHSLYASFLWFLWSYRRFAESFTKINCPSKEENGFAQGIAFSWCFSLCCWDGEAAVLKRSYSIS